jgi:hypothetical protein
VNGQTSFKDQDLINKIRIFFFIRSGSYLIRILNTDLRPLNILFSNVKIKICFSLWPFGFYFVVNCQNLWSNLPRTANSRLRWPPAKCSNADLRQLVVKNDTSNISSWDTGLPNKSRSQASFCDMLCWKSKLESEL